MLTKTAWIGVSGVLRQLYLCGPALAWNYFGHMTVAYVAYKNLTPKTKARALELLKLNPYYDKWRSQVVYAAPEEQDAQIFMQAATWADLIKRNGAGYISDDINEPTASRNIGYSDHFRHKYWHYTDLFFSTDQSALPVRPTPNVETQIAAFRKVIASNAPDELKSYDLTWLLHIVGDVHQPLHCTARVTKTEPNGDAGGNKIKLGGNNNLHWFWDSALGRGGIRSVAKVADKLRPADPTLAKDLDEKEWVKESAELAKKAVYVPPIDNTDGPFELPESYRQNAAALAKQQVELAGERLAKVLNQELK